MLLGAFGLGGICGALASPRLRERFRTETIVRGAFLLFAIGATGHRAVAHRLAVAAGA